MSSTIKVDGRSGTVVGHRLDRCIKHRIHELSIWMLPNGPADDQAIEAVNVKSTPCRWDLELGDIDQPLLVMRYCLEVAIDEVSGAGLISPT